MEQNKPNLKHSPFKIQENLNQEKRPNSLDIGGFLFGVYQEEGRRYSPQIPL